VIILDACTLALSRVLAVWEAFPGLRHSGEEIDSFAVDSGMKIVRTGSLTLIFVIIYILKVVVAMGPRIACWSLAGGRAGVWRIHSTLVLPKDTTVTALDCMSGNSTLFTVIMISLCGGLNTRVTCYRNRRRPISPHSEPPRRYYVVDSEVEVSVCNFFTLKPWSFVDTGVSVVPLSRVRFAPSLMSIATTALV
jgi:hypothetical protein